VALFIQRAQAVKPDFSLIQENALSVARLCIHLDGLPLAIELAAGRAKLFSPHEMLTHLDSRFQWLTKGARDVPVHQQTLQGTLDWSYNLLETGEQVLFRRLGVFVGGFTFGAAEAVCNNSSDLPFDVLMGIASLVDKNLLQRHQAASGELRFGMLETIQEYARTKLLASVEVMTICDTHLTFYLNLAETARPKLWGQEPRMLDLLEQEHANLGAALRWALERDAVEIAVRLVAALWVFWHVRGYGRQGGQWIEAMLALNHRLSAPMKARVLTIYGQLSFLQAKYEQAKQVLAESLALWQELDNRKGIAWIYCQMGQVVQRQGDYRHATALWKEGLALFRQAGNQGDIAWALYGIGNVARLQEDYERAIALLEESLVLDQKRFDR
jgi:tetratricopeptide (TPR) repeat protein